MQINFRPITLCSVLSLLTVLTACATLPAGATKDPRDPLERINRTTFKFDDALAHKVALPIARGYQRVTPKPIRQGIANVFENAHTPVVMVNDLLQAKFSAFGLETSRLLLNTTLGLGGLLDPATHFGLPKEDNDFGRTLGTWGIHPGPYLVLPLLGPSDFRDGIAKLVDQFAEPQNYIGNKRVLYALYPVEIVNTFSESLLPTYQLLDQQNAFDRYAFARNAYLQQRNFLIHGNNGTKVDQEELDLEKSLQDDSAPAPPAK
ncbi:MAG TPA: VacJ family lipoprotein [Steroidobacteraceae bacterium]|jgi:phospholipid-binding lipoprotein MlaA|nr:VacJ family lipoprotein [Steroidobacteraceae bacterium]